MMMAPGKCGEFLVLILPGGAVVAVEVGIFFQFRIAVGGQHFAVGVDIDAFALGLFQDHVPCRRGRGRKPE